MNALSTTKAALSRSAKSNCYFGSTQSASKQDDPFIAIVPREAKERKSSPHSTMKETLGRVVGVFSKISNKTSHEAKQEAYNDIFGRSVDQEKPDPDKNFISSLHAMPGEHELPYLAEKVEDLCKDKSPEEKNQFREAIIEHFIKKIENKNDSKYRDENSPLKVAYFITESINVRHLN